jgi:MscS family membrane protein
MSGVVEEIRQLILREEEVVSDSVMVFFRDLNASSLDIWVVYETKDPDFQKHMRLKQRLNLAFMETVEKRGLSFAFPSQTLYFEGAIARQMAERGGSDKKSEPERLGSS